MNARTVLLPLGVALVSLSGCVTGDTNPATAGLFDNIRNLQTGEYDRQIRAKDAEAAAITAANRQSQSNISALRGQSSDNAALIASLRSQIAGVRQEISRTRARVSADPEKATRLRQYERQLSSVEADVKRGSVSGATSGELRAIRSSVRALVTS